MEKTYASPRNVPRRSVAIFLGFLSCDRASGFALPTEHRGFPSRKVPCYRQCLRLAQLDTFQGRYDPRPGDSGALLRTLTV